MAETGVRESRGEGKMWRTKANTGRERGWAGVRRDTERRDEGRKDRVRGPEEHWREVRVYHCTKLYYSNLKNYTRLCIMFSARATRQYIVFQHIRYYKTYGSGGGCICQLHSKSRQNILNEYHHTFFANTIQGWQRIPNTNQVVWTDSVHVRSLGRLPRSAYHSRARRIDNSIGIQALSIWLGQDSSRSRLMWSHQAVIRLATRLNYLPYARWMRPISLSCRA